MFLRPPRIDREKAPFPNLHGESVRRWPLVKADYLGNKLLPEDRKMLVTIVLADWFFWGRAAMEDQPNSTSSSGMLATLMRAWSATRVVTRESLKPKPVTVQAYLLPQHMHHNRAEILDGDRCGCICCEQMFPQAEIRSWVNAGTTAVCPRCGTAAVVGSGAGFQLTPELLRRARLMLFEGSGRRA